MHMMIAAHAIVTGATLVTNDKAFAHVDEHAWQLARQRG